MSVKSAEHKAQFRSADPKLAALSYAEKGLRVLPLWTVIDGRCACGKEGCSPGRHPHIRNWQARATRAVNIICEWWDEWPSANIGILLEPGMLVLDVDGPLKPPHDNLDIPRTWTVRTARGRHYYINTRENVRHRNSIKILPNLDIITAGSFVVAPPSRHETGVNYEWVHTPAEEELATGPPWISEVRRGRSSQSSTRGTHGVTSRGPRYDRSTGTKIPQGQRETELTSHAGYLREAGYDEDSIFSELRRMRNEQCEKGTHPVSDSDLRRIANSVMQYRRNTFRLSNRILDADLSNGAKLMAALTAAGLEHEEIGDTAGVTHETVGRWETELTEEDLHHVARTIPDNGFTIIPQDFIRTESSTISKPAKVTGMMLLRWMRVEKCLQCTQEELAQMRGLKRRAIYEHVTELEAAGHLSVTRYPYDPASGARTKPNRYKWVW